MGGIAACLADARDVDGGAILHGAHFLARAAADAQSGIDVRRPPWVRYLGGTGEVMMAAWRLGLVKERRS